MVQSQPSAVCNYAGNCIECPMVVNANAMSGIDLDCSLPSSPRQKFGQSIGRRSVPVRGRMETSEQNLRRRSASTGLPEGIAILARSAVISGADIHTSSDVSVLQKLCSSVSMRNSQNEIHGLSPRVQRT